MKSKEDRFLELMSSIDINNPVMDFDCYGSALFWFNKQGDFMFYYNLEIGCFYFSYDKIWSSFKKEYDLNYTEIQTFMEGVVEEHLKFKDVTTDIPYNGSQHIMNQHFKLNKVI